MTRKPPSEAEVKRYFKTLSNWGRWGKRDEAGTLNLITRAKRKQAASLIREGVAIPCSRLITTELGPDVPQQSVHFMGQSGEHWAGKKTQPHEMQSSRDFIGMAFHGSAITHLDSLGHVFWDGVMYNGFSAALVTAKEGATVESVDVAKEGIVSRGVLLDLPRLRKVKWLERGDALYPEDLQEAERAEAVRVEQGDILLVRTGNQRDRNERGPWESSVHGRAGLSVACAPYLRERDVAVLGTDAVADVLPSGYASMRAPLHGVAIAGMGLWLIDNLDMEALSAACARRKRWEFFFTVQPLRIQYGTGSPVNPVAVL